MKLNLLNLEAERPKGEPFQIEMSDGSTMTLRTSQELHGAEIIGFDPNNPVHALSVILGDDFEKFMGDPNMTVYAMERIFTDWAKAQGLPVAQGEDSASRTSSTGSARPSKRTSESRKPAKVS